MWWEMLVLNFFTLHFAHYNADVKPTNAFIVKIIVYTTLLKQD